MIRQIPIAMALTVLVGTRYITNEEPALPGIPESELFKIEFPIPGASKDWSVHSLDLSASDKKKAGIRECVMRRYIHRATNQEVSLLLVTGRGGPISVHTPEVCFEGSGYTLIGDKVRYAHQDDALKQADFWVADFQKNRAFNSERLRIYWSWYAQGKWQAPENPRMEFSRLPVIHKLYLIHRIRHAERDSGNNPCLPFMRAFVDQTL